MKQPRTVVGLDIGANALKAVQVTIGRDGTPTIDKFASHPLPINAVQDGHVRDYETVTAAIKELWNTAKFTTRYVRVGIGDPESRVLVGEHRYLPDDEFAKALRHSDLLAEVVADPRQHIIDWHTLSEYDTVEENPEEPDEQVTVKQKYILLAAGNTPAIESRVRAVLAAKLKPISVDINSLALIRAYEQGRTPSQYVESDVSLDLGADTATIVFHKHGQPLFIRVVRGTLGNTVTAQIANSLDITPDRAEKRKLEHVKLTEPPQFNPENGDTEQEMVRHQKALDRYETIEQIIKTSVSSVISTMKSTAQHFSNGTTTGRDLYGLSSIHLSGGFSLTPTLKERLEAEFDIPVVYSQPLRAQLTEKEINNRLDELNSTEMTYAVAYGLAVGKGSTHA